MNSPTRIYTKGAAVYVTDAVLLPNNAFPSIEAAVKFYSAQLSTLTGEDLFYLCCLQDTSESSIQQGTLHKIPC